MKILKYGINLDITFQKGEQRNIQQRWNNDPVENRLITNSINSINSRIESSAEINHENDN